MLPGGDEIRFRHDVALLGELRKDPAVQRELAVLDSRRRLGGGRAHMLANAVRAEPALIPRLRSHIDRVREHTAGRAVEVYVYNDSTVNAAVLDGQQQIIVALSSGALNLLDDGELEFVIGHELGHAAFGHLEIAVARLVGTGGLAPVTGMKLRAWQRAAEISADRSGLRYCGSLRVAASALFKSVSGLAIGAEIDPLQFAAQWDHLREEVTVAGDRDYCDLSHPFPPLRMRAMHAYFRYMVGELTLEAVDDDVVRQLASMDPTSGDDGALGDTLLASFFFWGGLYIALADGVLAPSELERLITVAPPALDVHQLLASDAVAGTACLDRFRAELAQRRRKMSAVELHRIVEGLIVVASADGRIDASEVTRLHHLGQALGLTAYACDLMIAKVAGGS
jgi:tellurite resistance protein